MDDEDDDRPRRRRRRRDEEDDEQDEIRPRRKSKTPPVGSMDMPLIIGIGVGAVVLIVAGIFVVRAIFHNPFSAQTAGYSNAPAGRVPPAGPRPPVTKVVAVDVGTKGLDSSHWSLDAAHRAEKPEEVTTVLQLRWNSVTVGQYGGGGSATQWHVDATLVDLKSNSVLAQRKLVGSMPPQSFRGRRGESRSGDKPLDQITGFVREQAGMK